MCDNVKYI